MTIMINISEYLSTVVVKIGMDRISYKSVSQLRRNWKMEWAGREKHMGGIPRKLVIMAVGTFAKAVATLLNTTSVHNADTLIHLVRSRPPGVPLITVSNHMSTLDDPVMWGFKGFPTSDANLARWVLSAEDICFKNSLLSYFFRLGIKFLLMHTHWGDNLDKLSCSIIAVIPENFMFGRRPPFPLCNKSINIVIGEPIEFDLPKMREKAISMSCDQSLPSRGWPTTSPCGLDEAAQRCLYSSISEQIRTIMESLRRFGTSMLNQKV
ncbi:hypothetical protein EZV62_024678 [Acer yangbiense]|uniref:Tafazzin family protein n=1 Tax=Acer yangbiense TaxID=1000413 RepID=A0A5C7GVR6_9ROSI|nr:hypothetical protein EZV62_024678 [Acer yangbiense]